MLIRMSEGFCVPQQLQYFDEVARNVNQYVLYVSINNIVGFSSYLASVSRFREIVSTTNVEPTSYTKPKTIQINSQIIHVYSKTL